MSRKFEERDEFQYLAVLMQAEADITSEIKSHAMFANSCLYGLQKQLRSKLLIKETKFNI